MFVMPVFAGSLQAGGLDVVLSTDKGEYKSDDEITAVLTVKNLNSIAMSEVTISLFAPSGYNIKGNTATKEIATLPSGSEESLTCTFVPVGDKSSRLPRAVILVVIVISIGGLLAWLLMRKKNKSLLLLLLCLTMPISLCCSFSVLSYASETAQTQVEVLESVTVGGVSIEIKGTVDYVVNKIDNNDENQQSSESEEALSAEEFYGTNSSIVSVVDATTSEDVPTEAEVVKMLEDRGFTNFEVTYDCTIDGEYVGDTLIDGDAEDKHPIYQMNYYSSTGVAWAIFIINGDVIANPVSFNLMSTINAELLVSEHETLTCYDNEYNKFYINKPNESVVVLKIIERIDVPTLNQLTLEEIGEI